MELLGQQCWLILQPITPVIVSIPWVRCASANVPGCERALEGCVLYDISSRQQQDRIMIKVKVSVLRVYLQQ